MRHAREVVIVGILREASVVEAPRDVIHGVLLGLNGARDDFRHHRVVQKVIEMRFDRERFKEKLFIVLLLGAWHKSRHTPASSMPGRDARPIICKRSVT